MRQPGLGSLDQIGGPRLGLIKFKDALVHASGRVRIARRQGVCLVEPAGKECATIGHELADAPLKSISLLSGELHVAGGAVAGGWSVVIQVNDRLEPGQGDVGAGERLTPSVGDANTMIPETKAFMVSVEKKGRG